MRRLAGAGRAAAASGGTGGRAAALARSLRCAAGGLLLAFAALLALPPQAQAQTVETLVSNTGQTAGDQNGLVGTIAGSNWLAGQGFTTGDNTDGYTLSSVQLYIKYFDASDVVNVSIYSSVSDNPGSSLYVLTSPASIVNERLNAFTAPANATLEKDTEYIVVVEASGGGWFALPLTSSGAEDSGKASGWSISDARPVKQNLLAWRTEPRVLRISVMGTVNGGTAATGKPSISGTAQVGQKLTASTSGIMDVDGPPTGFTYPKPDHAVRFRFYPTDGQARTLRAKVRARTTVRNWIVDVFERGHARHIGDENGRAGLTIECTREAIFDEIIRVRAEPAYA